MEEIIPVFKVSELNRGIKETLENSFNEILVEGEISGLKESSLGHFYFDLKDENSIIACVLFKWFTNNLNFDLKNGLFIKVKARLTIYDKQSKYQLQVKEAFSLSIGPLQIAFEKLKEKLKKEGLFDENKKKKIPKFPTEIGVITSLQGAAIRDILSVLNRRYSGLHILIYPVKVQGLGAKEEIVNAIEEFNKNFPKTDVLLVGRGGGSMEDLWAFNEEIVARAIFNSEIPIISCVGHETDFTISDFVASLRAPTPSAGAEIVVSNKEDLIKHLKQIEKRLIQSLRIIYSKISSKFFRFINLNYFKDPYSLIEKHIQKFDDNYENLFFNIENKIKKIENSLKLQTEKLKNLNPYFPLKKGYALININNKIIRRVSDIKVNDNVIIDFVDGKSEAEIKKVWRGDEQEK